MMDDVWMMVMVMMPLFSYLRDMLVQVEKTCVYVCICIYVCVVVSRLDVCGFLYISETCLSSSLCLSVLTLVGT